MHLIQILLPLADNDGRAYTRETFQAINTVLVNRFGGVTAYTRSPAKGLWERSGAAVGNAGQRMDEGQIEKDDVIMVEVMADTLDRDWWTGFREGLEIDLRQKEIIVRAQVMERL